MAEITSNKQIVLKNYITGAPTESDMEFKQSKIDLQVPRGSGGVLLKNLYLSCDPYMRGRMRDFHGSYIPSFKLGEVIEGFGVSKVVDSDNAKFAVWDLVTGMTGWEEYSSVLETERLRKIEKRGDIHSVARNEVPLG